MPNGLTKGLKKVEEKVVSGARGLAKEAKSAEEKAVSKLSLEKKALAKKVSDWREQSKLAGEYEREYVSAPKHVDEAKLGALLAPKRPLTDLLGVKKEDGVYSQMVDKPCQLKFKCDNCPYYDKCKSGQKVAKPKTDEEMIDTFFGGGWDDMTKGWERLG